MKINKIFPVDPERKWPLTPHGYKDASSDESKIMAWQKSFPGCSWATPTGDQFFVVDVDQKNDGLKNWGELTKKNGEINTYTVKTRNDGRHFYFRTNGLDIRNSVGKIAKGIDIRGAGGYVVIPPSVGYEVINDTELISPPQWLLDLILRQELKTFALSEKIREGQRNNHLFKEASSLRAKGYSEEEILYTISTLNKTRCNPPLDDKEIETIAQSASRYEQGEAKSKITLTELGNAKRFIEMHKDKAKYCPLEKTWYIWNGKKWEKDELNKIYLLADEVIRKLYFEASLATDSEERKLISQHARRSESAHAINKMIELAKRPPMTVRPEDFDKDNELVNMNNGVVNLRTGELLPHDPKYLMRKIILFDYDPKAECPEWLGYLEFAMENNKEDIRWIQKALGLSISGRTKKILPFCWGKNGDNGKSVFFETLLRLYGDYGQKTSIEAMSVGDFHQGGDRPNSVIARMRGARFVVSNEVIKNVKLNVALIKDLTGGDTINVRDLREKSGQFTPTHTLWIYGNHKPRIDDDNEAIWNRVCEVPFLVSIPKDKQRPMDEVIEEFLSEASGILNWIIQGYQLMLIEGLDKTKSIKNATDEYRGEEDLLSQFLDDECELGDYKILKGDLLDAYNRFQYNNGIKDKVSKPFLTRRLKEKDILVGGNGNRFYIGVKLHQEGDNSSPQQANQTNNPFNILHR